MRMPEFLVVGAPKCGTTSVYAFLAEHPDIFLPAVKEPHFFYDGPSKFAEVQRLDDYIALFRRARPQQICGEASTCYILSSGAIRAALASCPNVKMIALIRNPIDMIVSYHNQKVYSFEEHVTDFADAWAMSGVRGYGAAVSSSCRAPELLNYREVARLGTRLRSFMEIVPPDQRLVILFDDLVQTPAEVYAQILDFLGASGRDRMGYPKRNVRKDHRWPAFARFVRRPPFPLDVIKGVAKKAARPEAKRLGRLIYGFEATTAGAPTIDPAVKRALCDELRDEVRLIEGLVRRDLRHWLADTAG